jgi:AcrR family transcriptional regulator
MSPSPPQDTRERLLEAVERLYAEKGVDGASLRDITSAAGANVAAVNYHFGSKDGLLPALIERRFVPLNRERIRMLDLAEAAAGDSPPTLESILQAFVEPTLRMCRKHPDFMRVLGRLHNEARAQHDVIFECGRFDELVARFRAALVRTLPDTPPGEIWWGMMFVLGALIHTWMNWAEIEALSGGEAAYESDEKMIRRMVGFAAAGLRAAPGGVR